MRHIKPFQDYNLQDHYRYIDSLIQINESLVDTEKIKQVWTKILDRVKGLPASMKRKIIIYGIASLMALGSVSTITNIIKSYQTEDVVIKDAVDEAFSQFKDATKLRVSAEGKEHIKSHEGIELTAYKLGDGKITIGYGHAEPTHKSKYRVGQKISKEEADKLFQKDLKKTADGVRRIFSEWKEKGIDRKITQDQFDALVSMAFNMGISGLRQTDLIQQIKSGNLEKAGELIKTTKINDDTFPGLRDRREKEAEMFMSYLNENQPDKG
jgi:GH24 family phage-related lysozyme (muramidase)